MPGLGTQGGEREQRAHMLRMAANWEALATEREQFILTHPALSAMADRADVQANARSPKD